MTLLKTQQSYFTCNQSWSTTRWLMSPFHSTIPKYIRHKSYFKAVTLIPVLPTEAEAYLHLRQSRCPVQDPLQMCSGRTPLMAGCRTQVPDLPCETRAGPHLGSRLPASRRYCSGGRGPWALSPAGKGKSSQFGLGTLKTLHRVCLILVFFFFFTRNQPTHNARSLKYH